MISSVWEVISWYLGSEFEKMGILLYILSEIHVDIFK